MKWAIAIFAIVASYSDFAQGTFQNLDFEMATVSPSPSEPYPNFVSIGSAIPDWTAYIGSSSESEVSYNSITIGTANISLLGPTWTSANPGIIDGSYSVILQAGGDPHNASVPVDVSLAQNGTIPGNAESINFDAWNPDNSLIVSFAGTCGSRPAVG